MSWAKSIGGGIILGALISVFPIDLIACPLAPFIAFALLTREKETSRRRQFDLRLVLSAAIVASMGALATQLPFKHLDERRTLDARCVTVADVAKTGDWDGHELPSDVLSRSVCAPSSMPTLGNSGPP